MKNGLCFCEHTINLAFSQHFDNVVRLLNVDKHSMLKVSKGTEPEVRMRDQTLNTPGFQKVSAAPGPP